MRRKLLSIISIFLLLSVLVSCNTSTAPEKITIKDYERLEMLVGDTLQLEIVEKGFDIEWSSSNSSVTVNDNGLVKAVSLGKSAIKAECQGVSDTVMIEVVEEITKAPETKPSTNQDGNDQLNNQGNNQGGSSSSATNTQYASSVAEAIM